MILDFIFKGMASGSTKILTSEDLARYLSDGFQSASGVTVTAERAMRYAAVLSCVRVLAESVGQLPLHLYEQRGREKLKATEHPLYQVLYVSPNQWQTAQEWKEWVVACLALHGNAYCQQNRVRGTVRELNPFHPDAVKPCVDRETREVTYQVQQADGSVEELPASEMLHIKLLSLDGVNGLSPVAYARETIGLGIGAERHAAGLFARNATPGGVLETDQTLSSKEVRDRLRDSWEERHAGAGNSNRIAVLEAGVKWRSISMPLKDAQWLEGRKFSRSEIAGLFRVPPHLIGDLERATFSNIEHSTLDFVVHGLMPYLTRIEQRILYQLLTPRERTTHFAKFTAAALLRGDMAARSEFYTGQVQNGAMSPNEIRELEDQNPREGGDIYLTPSNMLIDGKPPAAPAKPAPKPGQEPPDEDDEPEEEPEE
ncbi:MAG: phage portal protein [Patescibacteria group bacterium]|mgnify:CR=1 FL=1